MADTLTPDQVLQKVQTEHLTQVTPLATSTYLPETWSEIDQFMRCPIPPLSSSPDTINQFWRGNLPQYRMFPSQTLADAATNSAGGGGSTTTSTPVIAANSNPNSFLQGTSLYLQDPGGNWWKVTVAITGLLQTKSVSGPGQ